MMDNLTIYLAGFLVVVLASMTLVLVSIADQCNSRVTMSSYHKGMIIVPTRKQWEV